MHFSFRNSTCEFQKSVSQGAFAVINMSNNTEVSNFFIRKLDSVKVSKNYGSLVFERLAYLCKRKNSVLVKIGNIELGSSLYYLPQWKT